MAKVKIFLDKEESLRDAEDQIFKALNHHASGDVHSQDSFEDPAMVSVSNKMEQEYKRIAQDMMREISEALDEDYKNNYGY